MNEDNVDFRNNSIRYDDLDQITMINENTTSNEQTENTQQVYNFTFEEYVNLRDEIVETIGKYESLEMSERETLSKINFNKKNSKKLLSMANAFLKDMFHEFNMTLTETNTILYSTAKTLENRLGVKYRKKEQVNI